MNFKMELLPVAQKSYNYKWGLNSLNHANPFHLHEMTLNVWLGLCGPVTGVLLDPVAKLGSTMQEFSILPYFMVFCEGAFSLRTRTGALTYSIASVYVQWVEFLLPFSIFHLEH